MRFSKVWIVVFLFIITCLATFSLAPRQVESAGSSTLYMPLITQGNDTWPIGPDGGHIVSIAIDPSDPDVMYAGTWGAGMYRSDDGGQTWHPINTGLGNFYINIVKIDPLNPLNIYIGTQTDGVYKSTDGGSSWADASSGLNTDAVVYTIAINPSNPAILYAGTRSPGSVPPWGGGVYKSVDSGNTWQQRNQGLGEDWVYSIAINPNSTTTLYAATHSVGVYKSVDGAANWSAVNSGLTDLSTRSVVIDPGNPQKLLVGTWHHGGVYRSSNGGSTWSQAASGLDAAKVYRLTMDPTNSQVVYASTLLTGIYKTTNGGDQWSGSGLWPDFVYDVAVNPGSGSTVFAGTSGDGLHTSLDGGGNWSRSDEGLKATSITSLVLDPGAPEHVFASVYGGGVYMTDDRGDTWMAMNTGLEDKTIHMVVMAPDDALRLYAATDSSGVYLSANGGASWNPSNTGFPTFSLREYPSLPPFSDHLDMYDLEGGLQTGPSFEREALPIFSFGGTDISVQTIEIDQGTPSTIYVGTNGNGVYKSLNSGVNWSTTGFTAGVVNALAIDPSDPSSIFAAIPDVDGSMLRTFDAGTNWIFMNTGLNGQTVYAVEFDASTPGKILAGGKDGVYLSTNSGNSWSASSLTGVAVYSLVINSDDADVVYAGSADGFYISIDGGLNWEQDNGKIINPVVQSLGLNLEAGRIYLGTQGNGSYRRQGTLP